MWGAYKAQAAAEKQARKTRDLKRHGERDHKISELQMVLGPDPPLENGSESGFEAGSRRQTRRRR